VKITMMTSARNGMPYLEQCLESIVVAAEGLDVEIHYADACSTDGSAECAARLIGADNVRIEPDNGFGDAVNKAFRRCTGEIFAALPADDLLAPDALRHVAAAFEANPRAGWGVGMYEIIDAADRPIRPLHTRYKNFAVRHFHPWWLMAENILPWVSFFVRRDFRAEIGDLINEKECLANDYDYFIRCTKRARPLIIPYVLGRWRYHPTSNSGSQMRRMSQDAWKVCRSHTSNPLLLGLNAICSTRNALLFDKVG
jgi:glycosyltransferase involved in cell wall biosynthesis